MPQVSVRIDEVIEVDVDLDELETSDLLEELRSRKVNIPFAVADEYEIRDLAEKFRYALYRNDTEAMIDSAKDYFDCVHDMRSF